MKTASGAGSEELLFKSDQDKVLDWWTPDGRYLIFEVTDPKTKEDLWHYPCSGIANPFRF